MAGLSLDAASSIAGIRCRPRAKRFQHQDNALNALHTFNTFLLVLAAIFPVVNPPGSALVFLSLTRRASADTRRFLAARVAINAFFVMAGSLLVGTFVLDLYGISVPIIRVAGGIVVAAAGWRLLNQGGQREKEEDA